MRILELFSGYGTASFALKRLGIKPEIVGYSDIDKYANQCFKQNHCPNDSEYKLRLGDCTKINPNDLKDFDLLTGGFPCQSFSIAGKGLGELDTRGTLFHEIIRIAEVKKPKYMLLENVKGLTFKPHKKTFEKILSELKRIGYFVTWKILNTKDYGIPQNRERVFFVCFKEKDDFDKFNFPEKEELKIFLKDILEDEVDEKYYLTEEQTKRLISKSRSFNEKMCKKGIASALCSRNYKDPKIFDVYNNKIQDICPTLSEPHHNNLRLVELKVIQLNQSKESNNQQSYIQNRIYDSKEISPAICSVQPNILQINNPKHSNNRIYSDNGISPSLNAMQGENRQPFILRGRPKMPYEPGKRKLEYKRYDICPTLSENCASGDQKNVVLKEYRLRKLTPKECFRLQGFLNDEVNLDGLSNTQQYRLAGNGQSVNVVEKIFRNMFSSLNNEDKKK